MATPARPRGTASRQRGQHTAAAIRRQQDSQTGGGGVDGTAVTARTLKGGLARVAEYHRVRIVSNSFYSISDTGLSFMEHRFGQSQ